MKLSPAIKNLALPPPLPPITGLANKKYLYQRGVLSLRAAESNACKIRKKPGFEAKHLKLLQKTLKNSSAAAAKLQQNPACQTQSNPVGTCIHAVR